MFKKKKRKLLLSPEIRDNETNRKYSKELNELLKLNDCKNIALVGNYGSGKSSLLKTFFSKHRILKRKSLTITIGSYIVDKCVVDDESISQEEQVLVNRVEESILKQIIYRKSRCKFLNSSLNRPEKISFWRILFYMFIFLYCICYSINPYLTVIGQNKITISEICSIIKWQDIIMVLIFLLVLYNILRLMLNNPRISKIKIKEYEVELFNDSNSVFSRYLSEIIYFFQVVKYKIVVFEDLDRFPQDIALKVIQELKELNTILNGAYGIKKIVFIYSVKDNLFATAEDKNKFYDYNLSILPISTTFNSEMNLVGLLKEQDIYNELSKKVITIASKHIHDMRSLINIVNDYITFKKVSKTQNYDKLFAMVLFKNYYFDDYNKINSNDNIIEKMFDASTKKRDELKEQLILEKEEVKKDITEIEKENIVKIKELLQLLIYRNDTRPNNARYVTEYSFNAEGRKSINTFENITIGELENNKLVFYKSSVPINEETIYSTFGTKDNFIERCKRITDPTILENKKTMVSNIDRKIKEIDMMTINKFYEEYFYKNDITTIDDKNNILLYELIKDGFISNDYLDYISAPVTYMSKKGIDSLTASDSNYLMNVRQGNYSFDNNLTGYKTILEIIEQDLDSPYILNYDLFNFILDDYDELETFAEAFMNHFKNMDKKKLEFLIKFLKLRYDKRQLLLDLLYERKIDIWEGYLNNQNYVPDYYGEFLSIEILYNSKYHNIIKNKIDFIVFVEDLMLGEKEKNDLLSNSIVRKNILELDIKSYDLSTTNEENYQFLYNNNKYYFTYDNIKKITGKNLLEDVSILKKNITTKKLYDYISNNLELFYTQYYQKNSTILNDQELIGKIIYNDKIALEIKHEIYKREKFLIQHISAIDVELYEEALKYNHLFISWNNVINIYNKINNNILYEYVSNNIEILKKKKINNDIIDKSSDFFKEYVAYLFKMDFNLVEEILKIHPFKYEKVSSFSKNELILLIKNNCVEFNKQNYKNICKKISEKDRIPYIYNYYINKSNSEFIKNISFKEIINLAYSDFVTSNEKIHIFYIFYKKEKKDDEEIALSNFMARIVEGFESNKEYEIEYNKNLYNSTFKKLKNKNEIIKIATTDDKIIFKI